VVGGQNRQNGDFTREVMVTGRKRKNNSISHSQEIRWSEVYRLFLLLSKWVCAVANSSFQSESQFENRKESWESVEFLLNLLIETQSPRTQKGKSKFHNQIIKNAKGKYWL
jgi:hypothetical protein